MKILRRNLSLMLAVRYLNPLRTMFSIITLICLGGVALGVMVLIVVLSVMEGLQIEMEKKGFALQPHYTATLSNAYTGATIPITMDDCDWPMVEEGLKKHPNVATAYAKLEGMGFAQTDTYLNTTISFSSVQPENHTQIEPLRSMIVSGNFDLGMDNKCVISYAVAKRLHLGPGNRMTLTPISSNIEQMADIMGRIEGEMMTQANAHFLPTMRSLFDGAEEKEGQINLNEEKYREVVAALLPYADIPEHVRMADYCAVMNKTELTREEKQALRPVVRKLRQSELNGCMALYYMLSSGPVLAQEDKEAWLTKIDELAALDRDTENGKEIGNLRSLIVPVDLEIVGVYRAPENMPGPDMYVPLHVAQESVGYTDNNVMGICLRLKDQHTPGNIEQYFHELINRYRVTESSSETTDDMPPPVEEIDYDELETTEEVAAEIAEEAPAVEQQTTEQEQQTAPATNDDELIPTRWNITPWSDILKPYYELIANERVMMNFVLSAITLIASFCIMAVMFTMSMQRKREIAVLQALGATPGKIVGIFVWQGVIIGIVGAIMGIVLALIVLHNRLEIQEMLSSIGMDPFPITAHGIKIPAVYRPELFAKQAVIAFIMVTIASIIPAFFVSRQDPAKALRSN